jgi:hypothetical protein
MWPAANLAFGMAAPEKTIHYGGGFREDGEAAVFRKQKEVRAFSQLASRDRETRLQGLKPFSLRCMSAGPFDPGAARTSE